MASRAPDPTVQWETWSPAQAEKALLKNDVNRHIRNTKVEQYARDMLAGNWTATGDAIKFDAEGKLIDGQHRLTAQVKADMRIRWLVVRELGEKAQINTDMNIPRSAGDILSFGEEKESALLAAVARMVYQIVTSDLVKGRYGISQNEILRMIEEHPDMRDSVELASWGKRHTMTPLQPSVMATAHWMIMQKCGQAEADKFIRRIISLVGEQEGSAILALNSRLNEIKRNQQRVSARDKLNLVIKAWNYDADGRSVKKLATYNKSSSPMQWKLYEVKERKVPQLGVSQDEDEVDEPAE